MSRNGAGGEQRKTQHRQAIFSKFSKTFFFAAKFCCKEMLVVTPHLPGLLQQWFQRIYTYTSVVFLFEFFNNHQFQFSKYSSLRERGDSAELFVTLLMSFMANMDLST
jgi:hypothetical protein